MAVDVAGTISMMKIMIMAVVVELMAMMNV